MPIETTNWEAVDIGHVVRDKDGRMWTVTDRKNGWILLGRLNDAKVIETIAIPRFQRLADPVDIYIPTEAEALNLLNEHLGARILRQIEDREHTIHGAKNWRMEPMPRVATVIRDHLDMIHQVNVDDVLRKWKGTEANPATKKTRKQALDELCEAHDAVHEDPATWPQNFPHIHTLEKKEA